MIIEGRALLLEMHKRIIRTIKEDGSMVLEKQIVHKAFDSYVALHDDNPDWWPDMMNIFTLPKDYQDIKTVSSSPKKRPGSPAMIHKC